MDRHPLEPLSGSEVQEAVAYCRPRLTSRPMDRDASTWKPSKTAAGRTYTSSIRPVLIQAI